MTDDASMKTGTPVQAAKRQAVLVLSLVLLAGLLIGMAADRLWLTRHWAGRPHRDFAEARGGPGWPRGPGGPGMRGGFPGSMSPEHAAERRRGMVQRLTRELDLTAPQQQAVDSIMASNEEEFQALEREMRPRMKAFLERTRGQIDSVLTPAQREKFHNFGPPDGPPGPPPGEPGGPPPPEPGRGTPGW
jgi:Spy/CpxP family protein refolding chaperone